MRILAADTTTSVNTVAICTSTRVLAETVVDCGRAHSERLLETVDWVLGEAGIALQDVDALAISNGPGSFTGLRVGVAAWKGLALGADLDLVPVPTLDAMTRLFPFHEGLLCPLLDARMEEVFGAVYRFERGQRTKLTPDRVCPVEELLSAAGDRVTVFGDGAVRYADRIRRAVPEARFGPLPGAMPRASTVAAEAFELLSVGGSWGASLVAPVYLRKSQAEEAREKRTPVPNGSAGGAADPERAP